MTVYLSNIYQATEKHLGLPENSIKKWPTRGSRRVAYGRQVAYYIATLVWPDSTWTDLGKIFNRDRTSVREGVKRVCKDIAEGRLITDPIEVALQL